jgi:hypothetical protein
MSGFVTILKISAFVLVLGVLGALFLFLKDFQEDFRTPAGLQEESVEKIFENNESIGFEAGQYEFNQALELIALGEIKEARQGEQDGAETKALVARTPSRANSSKAGVEMMSLTEGESLPA